MGKTFYYDIDLMEFDSFIDGLKLEYSVTSIKDLCEKLGFLSRDKVRIIKRDKRISQTLLNKLKNEGFICYFIIEN